MSDDEMDMMYDDEDNEAGEEQEEEGAEIENEYYNAKGLIEEDVNEAIKSFENVVKLEKAKGEWGFKATKKLTKLYFQKKDNTKKAAASFKSFMEYTKSAVTSNVSEKGINSILDVISTSKSFEFVEEIFTIALQSLKSTNNDKVWFRTNLRYGKLLYDLDQHAKLEKVLHELHVSCQNEKGEDDVKKGSQLVDIYALEIQMYTAIRNNKKLKELYGKALEMVRVAIPHPRIMGVIRECGGKMHMREKEWEKAHTDFFEAFKCYDEAGAPRRIQCLKYLVLANMLMLGQINPFDSQEAKPYKNDTEIVAMNNLVSAYERSDIKAFEKILKENKKTIVDDSFMKDYIDDLLRNIRTAVLSKLLGPYSKIRMNFLAQELNISVDEVQDLLISLILDNKVQGKIDQINGLLELESAKSNTFFKYRSVDRWAGQLHSLHTSVVGKLA